MQKIEKTKTKTTVKIKSYLFKNCLEYRPLIRVKDEVPPRVRGIYILYNSPDEREMNVVYIGMSRGVDFGVGSRLLTHSKKKSRLWTHFSVYEVWDNITESQVQELEGLFRHVYAKDKKANELNFQKKSANIDSVRCKPNKWRCVTISDTPKLLTGRAKGVGQKAGKTRGERVRRVGTSL